MPIIGIIGRCGTSKLEKPNIEVLEAYRLSVIKSGGIPIVILPPQTIEYENTRPKDTEKLTENEKNILIKQIKLCDGILMPGGLKMFEYDKFICEYCNENKIPLLGICMGMQVMCNYNNDNINIKIDDDSHFSTDFHKHSIDINKNSKLFKILNTDKIPVNSFHHYKVKNSGIYNISATTNDVIEAIEKDDFFAIGVQWHPEKIFDGDINSQKLFKAFIDAANKNSLN